ncbi:hypothetical protein CLAFUW4_12133 [Fulvia fulva]|uniref:Uncharacterized protein n=1 Tax=Passalora fulva TaxID=5499 RepID=A0A9Q8USV2_PASFU|nr:uncharacterized protein CLAFUR5_11172 [Fulvia fulva]KAK4618183.1 hypothetical protein CLAFUR4_12138 [Fulvia fulva]KAK4619169.1 hypothetical protein CLAFUR0_12149 [Fulvia fulva]UJO21234.1 hypothetical protein CLAFUR5_11172 [Fulvia fulva]WPV18703.1 hypothetical protein CLAFUW4_12133 [Fulvia fulva]WPV33386.1 hypothetical protein CLAFUW7_12140 [Fulvia fulva]
MSPKLVPGHRNLAWNIPATLTDERPVLAVVELVIRSGINLQEPGTPLNNLLRKFLEYCSSLPDARVHCGQIRDQTSSVSILVELPSASAWQDSQASAALDFLVATFESNPICNCLLWTTPQTVQISGTVELFTPQLGTAANDYASNEVKQFEQSWTAFSRAIAATGTCKAHGNWVEPYCMVNHFSNSPPGRRAALFTAYDAQRATFLGLLCGEPANRDDMQIVVSEFVLKSEGRV